MTEKANRPALAIDDLSLDEALELVQVLAMRGLPAFIRRMSDDRPAPDVSEFWGVVLEPEHRDRMIAEAVAEQIRQMLAIDGTKANVKVQPVA